MPIWILFAGIHSGLVNIGKTLCISPPQPHPPFPAKGYNLQDSLCNKYGGEEDVDCVEDLAVNLRLAIEFGHHDKSVEQNHPHDEVLEDR